MRKSTKWIALSLLAEAGAEISYVVVDNLRDGVFLARVYITDQNGDLKAVDSRASDAIILGVSAGLKVHFAEQVINEAGVAITKEDDEPYI